MAGLRGAARAAVGPYGFGGGPMTLAEDRTGAGAAQAGPEPRLGVDYSGTNIHELGVDEPDLVKTDGRRVVTVVGGVLRVTDVSSRRITGQVRLADGWGEQSLLLAGDRALVISPGRGVGRPAPDEAQSMVAGTTVQLVDVSAEPRVVGTLRIDGTYLDARQVASTVRIVVRSVPRLEFPDAEGGLSVADRLAANRAIIDRAGPADWLPRYSLDVGGRVEEGMVDCADVSRPRVYSGASMVTVYSFGVDAPMLTSGDPVTVVADAQTVYGTATSLYIAHDDRWREVFWRGVGGDRTRPRERTELYRFDVSGTRRPALVAAGEVPGWLLNQYSLSEHDGYLRVATTTDGSSWGDPDGSAWGGPGGSRSSSAVYVLVQGPDQRLNRVGAVTGLGRGERVYAVRFAGPVGYVVTFRQTDPLYVLDLGVPAAPKVTGELKITGYSAYLHPAGDGRLIGVGQEATTAGRTLGLQVSLFDVGDPAEPTRLAQYHVPGAHTEAEFDPHAFLYWPPTGLLVVPIQRGFAGAAGAAGEVGAAGAALGLVVDDSGIHQLGTVADDGGPMRRSLVIGEMLWTVSEGGLGVFDVRTMAAVDRLRFG